MTTYKIKQAMNNLVRKTNSKEVIIHNQLNDDKITTKNYDLEQNYHSLTEALETINHYRELLNNHIKMLENKNGYNPIIVKENTAYDKKFLNSVPYSLKEPIIITKKAQRRTEKKIHFLKESIETLKDDHIKLISTVPRVHEKAGQTALLLYYSTNENEWLEKAIEHLNTAYNKYKGLGDEHNAAWSLFFLGLAYHEKGQLTTVEQIVSEALTLAQPYQDNNLETLLNSLGGDNSYKMYAQTGNVLHLNRSYHYYRACAEKNNGELQARFLTKKLDTLVKLYSSSNDKEKELISSKIKRTQETLESILQKH